MYEAVHARPDGDATVARLAATASDYGFDGVVVRNHGDATADYDAVGIREAYGLDVVEGVEVRAEDRSRLGGFIGSYRPETTVLLVHGGDPELNRFAVERELVDVLGHPMRGDGDVNHVIAEAAAENGVRLEVDLSRVLRAEGGRRVRAIADLRKLRELIEHADAPYVVSADPTSHLHLRAPRELIAVGDAVGFEPDEIKEGLREWERLAARNRERRSDRYVAPGVREGRYEEPTENGGEDA